MKVAIAYDWLNQKVGGGEATLFEIAKLYPKADIYCLIYNKEKFDKYLVGRNIKTSRLQKFPNYFKKNPQLLLPFIPKAVDALDFTGYDLVISVSSAWVKNIKVSKSCTHICYCFSPARMLWDSWPGYLDTQQIGRFKPGRLTKFYVTKLASKIRLWDYYSSDNVSAYIAISKYISERIKKYYGKDSTVIYPPVDIAANTSRTKKDYYLVLSVLSRYKNIELVIEAFIKNKQKLIIAGDGPDRERLTKLSAKSTNIEFVGRVSKDQKEKLFGEAKAFIFPSIEDFGITPIEALSAGTPVIAFAGGGLKETVQEGVTGTFFAQSNAQSLQLAIDKFEKMKFDNADLIGSAKEYSANKFDKQFKNEIAKIVENTK